MNKKMTIKEVFEKRGFSISSYSKAYRINRQTLYDVFNGISTGVKDSSKKSGDVKRIIAQLKKDKVWIGKLPWEK